MNIDSYLRIKNSGIEILMVPKKDVKFSQNMNIRMNNRIISTPYVLLLRIICNSKKSGIWKSSKLNLQFMEQ